MSPCYNAFLITADVLEIYMQQFWFTISKVNDSYLYQFQLDNKKFKIGVELFRNILCICPRVPNKEFVAPLSDDSFVTFLKSLGYKGSLIFTKVIIHYFLSKHKSIPKRHCSRSNCIKNDGVLGRLKFIRKGEDNQVYGMTIPDVMMNDDIKKSKAYPTYLAISTGIVVPKKVRKGMKATTTPTKKGSITTEENILFDPDEALQLGESMSLTEAKIVEEERRIPKGSSEGFGTKLEVSDETKGKSKGSSEGAGITPEVPDEPKGKSVAQDDDWGSDEEEVILSSDDERTESQKEAAKSETINEEEVHTEEEEQTDDEHYDEEVNDDEYVHDDVEKHDDADEEMNDAENADEIKDDQEMANVEKVNSEKTEEETVDNEQARNDQADKDDQANLINPKMIKPRALIFVTQKEKPKLPPSTSSLSLSSDYVFERLSNLEKKVEALSRVDHFKVIAMKSSESRESKLYDKHPKHKALYDALVQSLLVDEDDMDKGVDEPPTQKRRRHDDEGQDPPRDFEKEQKKRRRKDVHLTKKSSTSKELSKGKSPPKSSKTSKSVTAEESVREPVHKATIDVEELIWDDVVNDADQPQE
ncbi:hypothetical protein Tco_1330293 [Tanacetum coccineum]